MWQGGLGGGRTLLTLTVSPPGLWAGAGSQVCRAGCGLAPTRVAPVHRDGTAAGTRLDTKALVFSL